MAPFFLILLFGQVVSPTTPSNQKEEKETVAQVAATSRSIMLIDPKERASDYQKAFEILKGEKSTSEVYFTLADGSKISNVLDMKMMPNNTLVIFRYTTPKGIQFEVVEIEDIVAIVHK